MADNRFLRAAHRARWTQPGSHRERAPHTGETPPRLRNTPKLIKIVYIRFLLARKGGLNPSAGASSQVWMAQSHAKHPKEGKKEAGRCDHQNHHPENKTPRAGSFRVRRSSCATPSLVLFLCLLLRASPVFSRPALRLWRGFCPCSASTPARGSTTTLYRIEKML